MKKKILFLISSFFIFNSTLFAARLTIYNESGVVQDITVYAGNEPIAGRRIEPGKQLSINSGFKPFSFLVWGSPKPTPFITNQPTYEIMYDAYIPSSVTMLMGSIVLWPNGLYGINFDQDGASESKVRQLQGRPL